MSRIVVVAGEVSGDMYAARVIRKVKSLVPEIKVAGMGSNYLQKEGVNVIIDPTEVSTIGFKEAVDNIKIHIKHLRIMSDFLDQYQPDIIFLVDYSGFNMLMARIAYKKSIPVVNYFPPGAWIWGQWRAKWMARYEAIIAAVFPMEREVYLKAGAEVHFVGHPLLDIVKVEKDIKEIYSKLELNSENRVIGLMPGSRKNEIERLLPQLLSAAEKLSQKYEDLQFVLPLASGVDKEKICREIAEYKVIVKVVKDCSYEVMKISELIITAAGTATLEAAILNTPMVIVYKTGFSTYYLGKLLIGVDNIGLPNIIGGNQIVPELLQNKVSGDNIYREVKKILEKPRIKNGVYKKLSKVKKMLGAPGAITRTAKLILKKGAFADGGFK